MGLEPTFAASGAHLCSAPVATGTSSVTAERTALNFLCHLSGIASATAAVVASVSGYEARIVCTCKTTRGLRALEKYPVRAEGDGNHRFGLDDAMLIKDNRVAIAGGIRPALELARAAAGHLVRIELEASGRVTAATAPAIAATGVDLISIGWLTHSAPALDIGLDYRSQREGGYPHRPAASQGAVSPVSHPSR